MPRRWTPRRTFLSVLAAVAVALVAWGILRSVLPSAGASVPGVAHGRDYRDPLQLGESVKASHNADSAGCAKLSGLTYKCFVGKNGAGAFYDVTVAPDGQSWKPS